MPGHPVAFTRAEGVHHVVGKAYGRVEELAFAGGVLVCHCGLNHVAGAIHFVHVHVGPAVFHARKGVESIEVSVGLLRGAYLVDPLVGLALERRVAVVGKRVGHAFDSLVHVAVVEENARMLAGAFRGVHKVLYASGFVFNLVDTNRQRGRHVLVEARSPESVVYLYVREVHRVHAAHVVALGVRARRNREQHGE